MSPLRYDEEKELSTFWSWVIIILYSGAIMVFGLVVYYVVPDGPRRWNFGILPDPPGASIYHDRQPLREKVEKQIAPLPETKPDARITGPAMKEKRQ